MIVTRIKKDPTDVRRVTLDFSSASPPWLDTGETLTTITTPTVTLQPATCGSRYDTTTTVVLPADPTPLTILSALILPGGLQVQLFLESGSPGNSYDVSFVATGTSGRQQTVDVTVFVTGSPASATQAAVPPQAKPAYVTGAVQVGDVAVFADMNGGLADGGSLAAAIATVLAGNSALTTAVENVLLNLPTTLPATSGVLWNNGGVIQVS